MKVQVRKRKGDGEWSLAHGGMLLFPNAAAKLVRNYLAHGYQAEILAVPAAAQGQMFYR